jgi:hypothetical protein
MTEARTNTLAIVSGLFAGGFLFLQFDWWNNAAFSGWEWYQIAALLCGIGLVGVFREARFIAAVGLGIAPLLVTSVQIYLHLSKDPTCCNLWPIGFVMVLFFCVPTPFVGGALSLLLKRTRLPRAVYLAALTSGVVIATFLPNIQNTQRYHLIEKVPELLKQIYAAEIVYRTSQGSFTCDGTLLSGTAGKLGWRGTTTNDYFTIQHYTIMLHCPKEINPQSFRVGASSHDFNVRSPSFSIDETGKLVVEPPQ